MAINEELSIFATPSLAVDFTFAILAPILIPYFTGNRLCPFKFKFNKMMSVSVVIFFIV